MSCGGSGRSAGNTRKTSPSTPAIRPTTALIWPTVGSRKRGFGGCDGSFGSGLTSMSTFSTAVLTVRRSSGCWRRRFRGEVRPDRSGLPSRSSSPPDEHVPSGKGERAAVGVGERDREPVDAGRGRPRHAQADRTRGRTDRGPRRDDRAPRSEAAAASPSSPCSRPVAPPRFGRRCSPPTRPRRAPRRALARTAP